MEERTARKWGVKSLYFNLYFKRFLFHDHIGLLSSQHKGIFVN